MNSWKCARRLCSTGTVLEEQVHQHGLAAADLAMDVEAARRRLVLVGEQAAEQALLAQRLVAREPLLERGKGLGGARLRGVGLDRAGGDEGLIMGAERGVGVESMAPLRP